MSFCFTSLLLISFLWPFLCAPSPCILPCLLSIQPFPPPQNFDILPRVALLCPSLSLLPPTPTPPPHTVMSSPVCSLRPSVNHQAIKQKPFHPAHFPSAHRHTKCHNAVLTALSCYFFLAMLACLISGEGVRLHLH